MSCARFLVAGFCLLAVVLNNPGNAVERQDLRAAVATDETKKVNKGVFGVHGEMLWSPLRLESAALAKVYADLGFQVLRFPGGTTANYYLWKEGKFGCHHPPPKYSRSLARIAQFNQALDKKGRRYSINELIAFSKNVHSGVTLVANVMCGSPEDTGYAVRQLFSSGVRVLGIELGNELYYEEPLWAIPTPADYLDVAKLHARAAREGYPGVKVGLVASNTAFVAPAYPDLEKLRTNERYSRGLLYDRLVASANFGDAIVVHLYSQPGLSKLDKLRNYVDLERVYVNAISHFESRAGTALGYLHQLNPSKEVWVTEWGVAFYGWLRPKEAAFERTAYPGLFFARGLLSLFDYDYVTIANVHNLTDFLPGTGKVARSGSLAKVAKLFKAVVAESSETAPLVLVGQRLRHSTQSQYQGDYPEVLGRVFLAKGSDSRAYFFIINSFDNPYRLVSLEPNVPGFRRAAVISVTRLASRTGSDDLALSSKPLGSAKELQDILPLELPPYSITRIDIAAHATSHVGDQ